jgi:hypothetical protein
MVKLVFRSFENPDALPFEGADSSRLILRAFADDPNKDVDVKIQNLEPDDIMEIPRVQPASSYDPDFSVYYDLLDGFDPSAHRPIPRRILGGGATEITGDGKPCAPAGARQ